MGCIVKRNIFLVSYSFERTGKLLEERELRLAALRKVADKSESPTDCATFQVMEAGRAFIFRRIVRKGWADSEAAAAVLAIYLICVPEKARISHWPLRFNQTSPMAI